MLVGHCTDSAGFQLASAVTLMTPQVSVIKSGVKYLTLGAGESSFAAPYFGPLPAIAFLDYDHNLRLFLKCLKYTTLDMSIFPSISNSHVVTINHLKELKEICESSGVKCEFSNNDLLFARYLDQNSDAALKVFTDSVADLLMENVPGSSGTVLYIKGVVALFDPFLHPQCDPLKMQERITVGITVFRIWRKILELKKKRINAAKGAAVNPAKRGTFITYGCYKTAEILFAAATCHILTIFAHFSNLGPSAIGLSNCGTKTTERFISELQGKTNHLQSLDAQPTLLDIAVKVSKVQTNHLAEERIIAMGGKKQASTNRRRKSHQLNTTIAKSEYRFPASFKEFKDGQVQAFKKGVENGIQLFKKYCLEGVEYIEGNGGFGFLTQYKNGVPLENQFDGCLESGYAEEKLNTLRPTELLTSYAKESEQKITDFLNPEESEKENLFETSGLLNEGEKNGDEKFLDESDVSEDELTEEKGNLKDRWFITRVIKGKVSRIHIRQALKILINREYISRERSRRHIASKYVSSKSVDENHNVLCFRFVVAKVSNDIHVCKVAALNSNGKHVLSAASDNDSATCRLIPLERVPGEKHLYSFAEKVVVSSWLKVSNVLGEIGMIEKDGKFEVIGKSREFLRSAKFDFSESEDKKIAKQLSKSLPPSDFKEVEDVTDRKIDPETHQFIYHVKLKGQDEQVWLYESCFNQPIRYSRRSGLKVPSTLFAREDKESNSNPKKVLKRKAVDSNDLQHLQSRDVKLKKSEPTSAKKEISSKTLSLLKSYAFPKLSPISGVPTSTPASSTFLSTSTMLSSKSSENSINISDDELERDIISGCDKDRNSDEDADWCIQDDLKISEGRWLANKHLDKASKLLKKQFPHLQGLQKSIFGQSTGFETRFMSFKGERLQIHNDGNNHWVLSVSDGKDLSLYDSLKSKPTERLLSQLLQCYKNECENGILKIQYRNVCRQEGFSDCGLFAIAFATDIACGNSPENIHYSQTEMRPHLKQCFDNGLMTPFPRSNTFCQKTGVHYFETEM